MVGGKLEIGKIRFVSLCDSCTIDKSKCKYNPEQDPDIQFLICEDYKKPEE